MLAIFDNKLIRDDDTIILICDVTNIIKIEWCLFFFKEIINFYEDV